MSGMQLRKRARSPEEEDDGTVTLKGHTYRSSADVIAYLQAVGDRKARYDAQTEVLDQMTKYHSRASAMIEEVFKYIERDGAYRATQTKEEFSVLWNEVRIIV